MNENAGIRFINVSKIFPGVKALDNVSFEIFSGEVHALVGENGAGKSTLLNILHGVYSGYEGKILINGAQINFKKRSRGDNFRCFKGTPGGERDTRAYGRTKYCPRV